jgi:predicted DNA-binding transcriptional regulator AlpA
MFKDIASPEATAGSLKSAAGNFPRYWDKKAVAAMLDMSERTVSNFLAQGCPHLALGKRRVRFDMEEVRAWLKERFGTRRIGPVNGGGQQ